MDLKTERRARLARQGASDISLGTTRIIRALQALGHPERAAPPVIHVAGTNGKGSTVAFLKAMLEAGGYRVHAFTSPALLRAGEQIARPSGALSDDALDALADEVTAAAPDPLTPFETLTACAFLAFSREAADITLIETGVGGRDDATNVVTRPALTVLTPISFDHTDLLGRDLAAIARVKAGILKTHVPAVIGPQSEDVMTVIETAAANMDVALWRSGVEWMAFAQGGRMVFQDETGLLDLPLPALPGRHQITNAGIAIAATRALAGLGLNDAAIEQGLTRAVWPARLQSITRGALIDLLPMGSELWLDGAHNAQGAVALAEFAADRAERCLMPLSLIVGMLKGKDHAAFFSAFSGLATRIVAIAVPEDERSAAPQDLADAARQAGLDARIAPDLAGACTLLKEHATGPLRVFITGSLSLARSVDHCHAG